MSSRIPQRELSVTEIIDRTVSLYLERLLEFIIPFLFLSILYGIFKQTMETFFPPLIPPFETRYDENLIRWLMDYLGVFVGVTSISSIVFWVLSTLVNGIAVKYASELLEKGEGDLKVGFHFTVDRLVSLLGAGLITGVLMILGFICFIVPGVIVAIMFTLIVPVIIIENKGVFESLERSRRLVSGSWLKTFILLVLILIITGILNIVGEAVSVFFGPLRGIVASLMTALVQPIHPIALTYLYYSMRAKKEALPKPSAPQPIQPTPRYQPSTPSYEAASYPRFCTQCGQRLPPEAIFCPRCGRRIKRAS